MIQLQSEFSRKVRRSCKKARDIISGTLFVLATLCFVYFIFWSLVMCDASALQHIEGIFHPLASLFFPNLDTPMIYQQTSLLMAKLLIPATFMYYVVDKTEEFIFNKIEQYEAMQDLINEKRISNNLEFYKKRSLEINARTERELVK